jgi:ORF6N domain
VKPRGDAQVDNIQSLIHTIREQRVILDSDLARIYGVPTKALNQAIKRNAARFPDDFIFRLTTKETREMNRSQTVTGSQKHRDPRLTPYAFTEHGAIMAANVLNSTRAVHMSIFVVRAFLKMRAALTDTRDLAHRLTQLETELKSRLNVHEAAIVDVLQRIMRLLEPAPEPDRPEPRKQMGFHIKEDSIPYRIRRKSFTPHMSEQGRS